MNKAQWEIEKKKINECDSDIIIEIQTGLRRIKRTVVREKAMYIKVNVRSPRIYLNVYIRDIFEHEYHYKRIKRIEEINND